MRWGGWRSGTRGFSGGWRRAGRRAGHWEHSGGGVAGGAACERSRGECVYRVLGRDQQDAGRRGDEVRDRDGGRRSCRTCDPLDRDPAGRDLRRDRLRHGRRATDHDGRHGTLAAGSGVGGDQLVECRRRRGVEGFRWGQEDG